MKVFIQSATQLPANKQVQYSVNVPPAILALTSPETSLFFSIVHPTLSGSHSPQKLTLEGHGVLKDSLTLAFYNVTSGTEFLLQLKTRGGK